MENILSQAFSTGDIKIVVAALVVYAIVYMQRKDTKAKRDDAQESMDTRVKLLESEIKRLKDLDLDARLASIETSLKYIKHILENRK